MHKTNTPHAGETPEQTAARYAPRTASDIATTAASLVAGDREKMHGDKRENFENIAALWNAWLSMRGSIVLSGADVAKLMVLLKIARMESGEFNADDFTDAVGYAAIAGELSAPIETRR